MPSSPSVVPVYPPAAPLAAPPVRPRGPVDAWLVPLVAPMIGAFLGLFVGLFLEGDHIPLAKSFLGGLRILWDLLIWLGVAEALVKSLAASNTDQAAALTGFLYLVALGGLLSAVLLAVPVINLTLVAGGCFGLFGFLYSAMRLLAADARFRHGGYTVLRFLGAASVAWLVLGAYLLLHYSPGATAAFLAFTFPVPLSLALLLSGPWLILRALLFRPQNQERSVFS